MNELKLRMHHWAVSVPNLNEAIRWYETILGFDVSRGV